MTEIDFEDFAVSITNELIETKSDDWLIDFYCRLLDQRSLWAKSGYYGRNAGVLRRKPIIRLFDNTHLAPCDKDNKIQVYLPAETKSKYQIVKEILTQSEKSLKFLTELGLSKPDIFAETKEFVVPKYTNPNPDISLEEYFEDFEKLLIAFEKEDSEKKKELMSTLKNLYSIYSMNSVTGEHQFCKPNEVYSKSEDLVEYFKGFNRVFFVSDELYERFVDGIGALTNLLLEIGCENKPRRIGIKSNLSNEEKSELSGRPSRDLRESHTRDYDYEGMINFLNEMTEVKSLALWHFLLMSLESRSKWDKLNFFKGEYSWFYYSEHSKKFEAKFLKTLKKTAWIVDRNNNFVLPSQISLSELPDCYAKDGENVEILIDELGFQIDEIKRVEEKYGGVYIPAEQREKFEKFLKWEAERSRQEENKLEDDNKWIPEVEAESVEPIVEQIEPEIIETPDYRGQRPSESNNDEKEKYSETDDQDKPGDERSKKELKEIGNWGEKYVFNHLQKEYANEDNIEIIWLNKDGDVGKGYDFSILSNGIEIEYIEVKSKIDETPQLFQITGTQWEFARKLYNESEGDKYKIYIVKNAGTENSKIGIIRNPTKLWKEGKLYAHPVQFKL